MIYRGGDDSQEQEWAVSTLTSAFGIHLSEYIKLKLTLNMSRDTESNALNNSVTHSL
ncbi:MAG: hypothetical protein HRT50_13115 [Colwellia sp.]|uniref:hypothetical protein n=1 Tax=Colwellia sp. TaxID=56799 RepID=UPI001D8E47BC|nr:hypothetical protein [Colwellia sp.]NQY50017.1 hypothetical protein [Colwellia sp.]